ncbi:MAG: hypothetical protein QNJ98_02015 [Planctomycetota bacterium]|nr:hypothetical protein [Planctomycetota bacterium]
MEVAHNTEYVRTNRALHALLDRIEAGKTAKPDWIDLEQECRLDRMDDSERSELLTRMHGLTLRGFKANNVKKGGKRKHLAHWIDIARHGFHDFADDCWMKCYDSPHVESYDYISAYVEGGIDALDAYKVYSCVLGTWEYSVEDFIHTELCKDVKTIVEPLAGSGEFCHAGHFFYPDFRYVMFDLDADAKVHVEQKWWHERTRREYFIANALDEATWQRVRELTEGPSLSYIGKQSQNFFGAQDLLKLLEWGTKYTDYFMLEVSEPYLVEDEPTIDDLTRKEMKAAGFKCALEDDDDNPSNPLTNELNFALVAWDERDYRELFEYRGWVGWQAPTLVAFGQLLGLEVRYFHSEDAEFLPVTEGTDTCDCQENNTFMMFRRP